MNILKIVLDSSTQRIVSWRKLASWIDDWCDGETSFEFKGSVVFCTNLDFERELERTSKLTVHYSALMDRSLYLSLTLRSIEDYLERIEQVCIVEGQFEHLGLSPEDATDTMRFIRTQAACLYTVSIRSALQIAHCRIIDPVNWQDDVAATKMRTLS